jgi:hypothetical protein
MRVRQRRQRLQILDERVGVGDVMNVSDGGRGLLGEAGRPASRPYAHKHDYGHENGYDEDNQTDRQQYIQLQNKANLIKFYFYKLIK